MVIDKYRWFVVVLTWIGLISSGVAFGSEKNDRPPISQVIASDAHGMTILLAAPEPSIQKVSMPGGGFDRLAVAGWGKTSRVGYPELPILGWLIQVPDSGEVRVDVADAETEDRADVTVYPVPEMIVTEDMKAVEQFTLDANAYAAAAFYPERQVEVSRAGRLRGMAVARVEVHPYQWHPAERRLRWHRKLKIVISFERSLTDRSIASKGGFEEIGKTALLNGSASGVLSSAEEQTQGPALPEVKKSPDRLSSDGQGESSMRIEVAQDGLYRLTYEELVENGLPASVDPRTFQLYCGPDEMAIRVATASTAAFAPGDFIEFYGEGLNTQFTDANVYWLKWGDNEGKRVGSVDGSDTGSGTLVSAFYENLHIEENKTWWSATPGAPDVDYWFWAKMTGNSETDTIDCSVEVPSPVSYEAYGAMRIGFQGRSTAGPHHTLISLNGYAISDQSWTGDGTYTQTITGSQSILKDGANTCRVELPGDLASIDIVYLNWIEIDYWRQLKAVSDRLTFRVADTGPRRVQISGFSSDDLLLYDISDPRAPKRVVGFSVPSDGALYKAIFGDESSLQKRFWIGSVNAVLKPQKVSLWQSRNLKSASNGADWIVITKSAFLEAVAPLKSLRETQGLRAKAVAVEDIYNEFNYGVFDPSAIKAFLQYAYANWARPAPSFVFFVGDASTDYRNYLSAKQTVVPAHLYFATYLVPTDNWYVCMDGTGDVLPDMFVGRIPGSSSAMVSQEVSKITGFKPASSSSGGRVLLIADNNDTSFEEVNEVLVPYLPTSFDIRRVYLRQYTDVSAATDDIIRTMDQGVMIANYVGHGNTTIWAGEPLFTNTTVDELSNGNVLPFVSAMTCLNGYFSLDNGYCLSEAFLAGANRGAIGMAAPSGLGYVWEHNILDQELFSTIFSAGTRIMGPAVTQAKIAAYGKGMTSDSMQTFTLFGDPATVLIKDALKLPVVETSSITSITFQSAKGGGTVTSDGGASVTARGVCWGKTSNPTTAGSHSSDGTGTGTFTSDITGLTPGTTYYVLAYATNSVGTAYGSENSFTTEAFSGIAYVNQKDPTCGNQTPCFSTIQDAVDSPLSPHTIVVGPGTYTEHVVVNSGRSVLIEGSGQETAIQSPGVINGSATFRNLKVIP